MDRAKLEMMLSSVDSFQSPKISLDQYATPAAIAADVLVQIDRRVGLEGKAVADFGAGPGIFSLGATLFRPK